MASTKAAAKSIESHVDLVTEILELTDKSNDLASELKTTNADLATKTKELGEVSTGIFFDDIGAIKGGKVPEVYGNHEYTSGSRLITVNFKMQPGGMTMREINGHRACDVLSGMLGKDYNKLFSETVVINDDADKLNEVAKTRPDLIDYKLNVSKLSDAALTQIRSKWPDAFTPSIKDEAMYVEEITGADVSIEVSTTTGFIASVGKLEEGVRFKLRDLFRKIFTDCVTTAVKCGNKASS